MKTLTVQLDDGTLDWLKQIAEKARKKEDVLVREWIEERRHSAEEPSCFERMRPAWRSIKNGPKDLSKREEFGE